MTRWDKIKDALQELFDLDDSEEFAHMIADVAPCCICRAKDYCNSHFYLHDNDGNYIFDENDEPDYDPTFPGCEQIIEDYLTEEISE